MGSAAARALGPNRGTRPRLHLAVQYSFRNRGRRLHHVGSSSQPGGTGIRGNGGRSRRVRCRNQSSLCGARVRTPAFDFALSNTHWSKNEDSTDPARTGPLSFHTGDIVTVRPDFHPLGWAARPMSTQGKFSAVQAEQRLSTLVKWFWSTPDSFPRCTLSP